MYHQDYLDLLSYFHASLTNMFSLGMGKTAKKTVNGSHQIVSVPMSHASTPSGRGTNKSTFV